MKRCAGYVFSFKGRGIQLFIKRIGWRGKVGFTYSFVVRCRKVRQTPSVGDCKNDLVSVGMFLCRGCFKF